MKIKKCATTEDRGTIKYEHILQKDIIWYFKNNK